MRYLVGFMMVAFLLIGAGLVLAAVRDLILKLTRMIYFRRATGIVVKVERERQFAQPDDFRHRAAQYRFFPVIKFNHLSGREATFRSAIGDGGETSKYRVGQRIAVVYDVDDKLPPTINSWAGVWLPVLILAFAGLVFIGGAALIYFAFGAKIFGKG